MSQSARAALGALRQRLPWLGRPESYLALVYSVLVLVLANSSISAILKATGGTPAAPLDDSYIHFQFARALASGEPFQYSPETAPVPGATSLLWPMLLALPYAAGLREHSILWAAWAMGFAALGLLAWEARRAAQPFCSPVNALGASALVLAFGANTWFAASGMEVVPLAWLLLRSVRVAGEHWEATDESGRRRRELLLLAVLLPAMRPEGMLGSLLIAGTLAGRARGLRRLWALPALLSVLVPGAVAWLFTGRFSSTTAVAKWLPMSPYGTPESLLIAALDYTSRLIDSLLDGGPWSALFLPEGSAPFAIASLLALAVAGYRRRRVAPALLLIALSLGILLPATYDCPLCNRLRYLWPFLPAWMVGTAALAELLGEALGRRVPELRLVSHWLLGGFAGALAGYLPFAVSDLATSANAIYSQQVSLGMWARDALPPKTRIGVNDAGAVAYFSEHTTFDVVGLTTNDEARYWSAGAGSRFEHYERLGPSRLPTLFIVYPEWFAIHDLLGAELTARYVPGATILGGERMSAHRPDYSSLGSAEHPDPALLRDGERVIDRLDVADLESEAEHRYDSVDDSKQDNVVLASGARVDGARLNRVDESFRLRVAPGGALVYRVASDSVVKLGVTVGKHEMVVEVPPSRWHEGRIELPKSAGGGPVAMRVRSQGARFASMHYFSLGPLPP